MQLEHSFTVPVGVEQAWDVLLDIERIAPCMPGAAIESVDGDDFTGSVKVKLGPINLTYKGKASFVEKDVATHRAVIDARGKDARGAGTAAAKITATLTSDGEASTKVIVVTDLDITGKPAQFGRGVMVDVGNKLIGQFADCLAGKLGEGDAAAVGADAVSEQTGGPGESPTNGSDDSAADATATGAAGRHAADEPQPPAPQEAAAAETAGASAAPPVTSPPADSAAPAARATRPVSAPAPREVEPIDLMASAGPAVAKRLAPVAGLVLLALLLIVLRRRRG